VKVISAVVAVVGVATIFAGQLGVGVPAAPLAAVFGAATVSAVGAVLLRRAGRHSPWTVNAIGAPIGAAMCLAASVALGEPRAIPSGLAEWWPVLYLAILGSLGAYVLFAYLVNRWSATNAAFIGVIVPVIALILGALIRHEIPPLISFAGAAIVIAAVVVALTRSRGAAH
jgi:drug/metabolite transporter (DMT)-like permease